MHIKYAFKYVGSNKNGIAYGPWVSITGFSEAVVDWIRMHEAM